MPPNILPTGLSRRATNLLTKVGFTLEKDAILHALRTGKLYPYCTPPNYGQYTHREVCRWVGIDPASLPQTWPDTGRGVHPDDGLSYRAHTILHHCGIPADRRSIIHALRHGALVPSVRPAGYGQVTHAEICRWAGEDSAAQNRNSG